MREPRKATIEELLSGDTEYFIPRYQRAFDWKSDSQVSDLMRDLISSTESNVSDTLYLGPVIFDVSEGKTSKRVEIVDGQQRVTTLSLLIMAMRDYARDVLENESFSQSLQKHISNSDGLSRVTSQRLSPSPVIQRIFAIMSDYSWDRTFPIRVNIDGKWIGIKREVNRVKSIYQYCYQEVSTFAAGNEDKFRDIAYQLRSRTFIIKIEIEDKAEAFEVFERTNARGKGLEVADLLKNYIFSREEEVIQSDVEELWDDIMDSFGSSPLKALKQFWISRAGKLNARELYRHIRAYADSRGINNFLSELKDFSAFYSAYNSDDTDALKGWLTGIGFSNENMILEEFRRSVGVLKLFNITQPLPLLYSVCRAFQIEAGDKKAAKKLLTMLRTIEQFHFVNNKVGGRIGNESENAYARFAEAIYKKESLSNVDDVIDWFKTNMLSKDEFSASFAALSYENKSERNVIRYVFDRLSNDGVKDGQAVDLLDLKAANAGVRPSYDIEHLAAQALAEDEENLQTYHAIGNLLVIPKQINGILGSKTFSEKMAILKNPHEYPNDIKHVPSYVQEFVALHGDSDWSSADIEARTSELAQSMYVFATQRMYYK